MVSGHSSLWMRRRKWRSVLIVATVLHVSATLQAYNVCQPLVLEWRAVAKPSRLELSTLHLHPHAHRWPQRSHRSRGIRWSLQRHQNLQRHLSLVDQVSAHHEGESERCIPSARSWFVAQPWITNLDWFLRGVPRSMRHKCLARHKHWEQNIRCYKTLAHVWQMFGLKIYKYSSRAKSEACQGLWGAPPPPHTLQNVQNESVFTLW